MHNALSTTFNRRFLKTALSTAVVLCAGFGVNSTAAPSTATASATVLVPIAITKASDLAFGSFAHGAGGTVTVSTSGARTASGPILSSIGATPTAAKFNVTGDGSSTYSVTFANTSTALASTSTPADTMTLAIFSSFSGAGATSGNVSTGGGTLASGAQSIYVGGALTVSATQVAHADYTGSVAVAVEYN